MKTTSPVRRRAWQAGVAVLVAALALTGCSTASTSGSSASAQAGGTITIGRTASVTSFDVNKEITANNAFAIDKVFESLVSFGADGAIIPWLASDYTISSDGLTYVFTLRDGVKFSDGTPLGAKDVVFSLERHLKLGADAALPLDAPISAITASSDDKQVTIALTSAYTPLLAELSSFSNGIFPANFGGKAEETFFAAPIGTGPFVVSTWDTNGDLTFVKNTNYWQPGKPYIDKLVYKLVPDDTQLLQQLQAGQLDAIDEVPYTNVTDLQNNASTTVATNKSWEIEQVFFNTKNTYFADEHVRRAIAQAIDRAGLTQAVTFGTGTAANSLIPPTISYSATDQGYALNYDVSAAKAELAKSAYPDGFSVALAIKAGNSAVAQEAQIVQEALKQIGITVTINSLETATFRKQVYGDLDYDFMINSGQSDYPDPDELVTFQADPTGWSKSYWTSYSNPEVTSLITQGRVTPSGDARQAIYFNIQKILANEVPYIPLYYTSVVKATTSKVHGLTVLPNGSIRFQDAWIEH